MDLLRLQRKMKGFKIPEPSEEWFESFPKRIFRRASGSAGRLLFFGSYILLLGYTLYSFFSSSDTDLFLKLVTGGVVFGALLLFGVTIADRMKERKTDKYRGVMK